jgi:hypothetical protein
LAFVARVGFFKDNGRAVRTGITFAGLNFEQSK